MNIEHAKTIALRDILEKTGFLPVKEKGKELWYLSPFRKEKTPSFHLDTVKNIWFDFGENKGGNVITYVQAYLKHTDEDDTFSDALRWLKNMIGDTPLSAPVRSHEISKDDPAFVFKKAEPLRHIALTQYIQNRGITLAVANQYLEEVTVYHVGKNKSYFALGFKNEEGGYELRNPYFKGCISPKQITFIRGSAVDKNSIHIFEGFMDFLSVISQRKGKALEEDAIILNSLSKLNNAAGYIKGYDYKKAFTWLDNDLAGREATETLRVFLASEHVQHQRMNALYMPHKDVNAWHMHKLGLKL